MNEYGNSEPERQLDIEDNKFEEYAHEIIFKKLRNDNDHYLPSRIEDDSNKLLRVNLKTHKINKEDPNKTVISIENLIDLIEKRIIDSEEKRDIDSRIHENSIDFLAYYLSLHFYYSNPFPRKWGIFMYDWGIRYLADDMIDFYKKKNIPITLQIAILRSFKLLHRHERYHWYVDAWTIDKEALLGKDLYAPYMWNIYKKYWPRDTVEEALANHHVTISLKKEGMSEYLHDFMKRQSGMYARYDEDKDFFRARLASQIVDGNTNDARYDLGPWLANSWTKLLEDYNCPVYIIQTDEIDFNKLRS